MMDRTARSVVVGVDGSEGSDLALAWAAGDAQARRSALRIVAGYEPVSPPWAMEYAVMTDGALEQIRLATEQIVDRAVRQVRERQPDLDVSGAAVQANPVRLMVGESEQAAVVVIGSRRLGSIGSLVLGSVATGVAPQSGCPLVVVRGPGGDASEGADATATTTDSVDTAGAEPVAPAEPVGPPAVIAGIDGSAATRSVLDCAFDHADRHRAPLRVLLCWPNYIAPGPAGAPDLPAAPDDATRWLAETTAGFADRYPQVTVRAEVRDARPVDGLVEASRGQLLLVVGTRGRGALAGLFLGSVSQGVLHHSVGPVAVVPVADPS